VFCREHALQLQRDREEFEAAGVELAVIGQGTPENAEHFRHAYELDLRLLVDPERRAYAAAGAKVATFSELLGARVMAKGARRAAKAGVRQGKTIGHAAQLGGVLVVAPGGEVAYAHMSDDASDTPPNAEVLEAARAAAA
jgi:peroxiredoxin